MREFEDALKIVGQGIMAFFLLVVMAVLFGAANLGVDFNPFADLLAIAISFIFLIIVALFIFFVIWIIREFVEFGGRGF